MGNTMRLCQTTPISVPRSWCKHSSWRGTYHFLQLTVLWLIISLLSSDIWFLIWLEAKPHRGLCRAEPAPVRVISAGLDPAGCRGSRPALGIWDSLSHYKVQPLCQHPGAAFSSKNRLIPAVRAEPIYKWHCQMRIFSILSLSSLNINP